MVDTNQRVRMSVKYAYQMAIVGWVDLLGYGSQISEAQFVPTHPKASEAHLRLRRFHRIVSENSRKLFPSLVMNDGAIVYRDLSYRSNSVTYDFIRRAWNLFNAINEEEQQNGDAGARMVVAAGFRLRGRRAGIDQTAGHLGSILKRFELGEISSKQAIYEASRAQAKFDIIPQLQSNYAFTKAYVAESGGSKKGFTGNKFYLDMALLASPITSDVVVDRTVKWQDQRLQLSGSFGEISNIVDHGSGYMPRGAYRDGVEVAQNISNDPDILAKLRKSKLSGLR
tara:strand:+ start:14500 stop:15348 length:849 start_codon:yes stop_codon:yes gene_type:complete